MTNVTDAENVNESTGEIGMSAVERNAKKAGLEAELKALKEHDEPIIDTRDGIAAGVGAVVGAASVLLWEAFF